MLHSLLTSSRNSLSNKLEQHEKGNAIPVSHSLLAAFLSCHVTSSQLLISNRRKKLEVLIK